MAQEPYVDPSTVEIQVFKKEDVIGINEFIKNKLVAQCIDLGPIVQYTTRPKEQSKIVNINLAGKA